MRPLLQANVYQIKDGIRPIDFKKDNYSEEDFEKNTELVGTIIFEKPLSKGKKVKDLLTGIEFDSTYYGTVAKFSPKYDMCIGFGLKYRSLSNNVTTVAKLHGIFYHEVSSYELKQYMEDHKDVFAYKQELEKIKHDGLEKGKKSLIHLANYLTASEKGKLIHTIKKNRRSLKY